MRDLFLQRTFDAPVTASDILQRAPESIGCFELHRVTWRASLLSADGYRLTCCFAAADMESVRIALRQLDADLTHLWPGTVHDASGISEAEQATVNVVVERSFAEPVPPALLRAAEERGTACREAHGVTYLRSCLSTDGQRMFCLYRAPDAESVRRVQRETQLAFDRAWPCTLIRPPGRARK
jgi:Protein of unknown function (DUF4242)